MSASKTSITSTNPVHYSKPKLEFQYTPPYPSNMETVQLGRRGEEDPSGLPLNSPGAKGDAGKLQAWLFMSGFSKALREVAKVTTKGAEKYTRGGWKTVPNGVERYMEAFGRHLFDLGEGQVFDDGPNGLGPDIYHKASMVWNLLASLELELREMKK